MVLIMFFKLFIFFWEGGVKKFIIFYLFLFLVVDRVRLVIFFFVIVFIKKLNNKYIVVKNIYLMKIFIF